MMNYIWVGLVVIAVVAGAVTGTMEGVLTVSYTHLPFAYAVVTYFSFNTSNTSAFVIRKVPPIPERTVVAIGST